MKPLHCVIIVIASFILLISVNPIFAMEFSQNNMSGTSKIDPKVLKVLDRANSMSNSFHILVDVMLENQSDASNMPKNIEMVYSKNNIIGVAVDHDQIMNL